MLLSELYFRILGRNLGLGNHLGILPMTWDPTLKQLKFSATTNSLIKCYFYFAGVTCHAGFLVLQIYRLKHGQVGDLCLLSIYLVIHVLYLATMSLGVFMPVVVTRDINCMFTYLENYAGIQVYTNSVILMKCN